MRTLAIAAVSLALLGASCSGSENAAEEAPVANEQAAAAGVRTVPIDEAVGVQSNAPSDLVILDVRTADEFNEGHIEGAIMLDFYDPDFAAQIAELDPDVPYLLYCRSGNRSGQTADLMEQLDFADVADVDGGVLAWSDAGLPLVTE